jgi:site-specific recombinase XerD
VEEIIAVMRAAGVGVHGDRIRALVVVLWRAGLRISEALALAETDLEPKRGSILVRRGKGGKRREVGMDRWAWDQLEPWLSVRAGLLVGALFCVLRGLTRGRAEALVFAVSLLADAHDDDVSGFVLHAGFSPPGSAESPDAPSSYAHVSGAAE